MKGKMDYGKKLYSKNNAVERMSVAMARLAKGKRK